MAVLGLGMWQSPEINREGFLAAWSTVGKEPARLTNDPFAILGILVTLTGMVMTYHGFKHRIRG